MTRILAVALNPAIDISCDAENVQPTHKIRTFNQKHYAGGGGTNVARVIAQLGGMPELLYLSGGATGALLEDFLERLPIRQHRIAVGGSVRIAFMVHEMQSGFEYRFVPEGQEVHADELKPALDFVERFAGAYVVASGSLPRGAPSDTYARMADFAARNGARFILDTSGDALKEGLSKSCVFLVKPSLGELEGLVGERLDEDGAQKAAVDLVLRGCAQYVAVTMGLEGAFLAGADGVLRVPSRHVTVRSAVGAGDSFVGAMVLALAEGKPIEDAFRFGVAAGAAAVMTAGTELCRREDVLELYKAPSVARRAEHG